VFRKNFTNKKFTSDSIKLLKDVTAILEKNDIEYYLDFGTLLGVIREKRLIPWDNDLDISILHEKDYKKVYQILKNLDYSIKINTFKQSNNYRKQKNKKIYYYDLGFTDENNIQIIKVKKKYLYGLYSARLDIFFKYKKDNYLHFVADGKKYKIDAKYVSNGLITEEFFGKKFTVLKDYEEYLNAVYGNWQKPDKLWNKEDCLTLVRE
jgi:phosphorylcholine metabolism protein LicD